MTCSSGSCCSGCSQSRSTWRALETELGPVRRHARRSAPPGAARGACRAQGRSTRARSSCVPPRPTATTASTSTISPLLRDMMRRPASAGRRPRAHASRTSTGAGAVPADRAVHGLPARDRHQLLRARRLLRKRVHRARPRRYPGDHEGVPRRDRAADDGHHHPPDGRRAARLPVPAWGSSLRVCSDIRCGPIDCQNLFCELDKYARVRFPELVTNRSRIKATFTPDPRAAAAFYPPKWGLNEQLPAVARLAAAA